MIEFFDVSGAIDKSRHTIPVSHMTQSNFCVGYVRTFFTTLNFLGASLGHNKNRDTIILSWRQRSLFVIASA
jgi:hypothetical protein